jgi:trimeric autotransporter adhesin
MKNKFLIIGFIPTISGNAQGQTLFSQLGEGLGPGGSYMFVEDELEDVLYISGSAIRSGNEVVSPGIFKWDGNAIQPMDCGFNWNCSSPLGLGGLANPVLGLALWAGDLYAGGDIVSAAGIPMNNVVKWGGSSWLTVGDGVNGYVTNLKAFDDGLYAVGSFTEAGGVPAYGLARWDGITWHSVFDLPLFGNEGVNLLYDVEWYQGRLYIGGNFGGGNGLNDIAYYENGQWHPIGQGLLGVFSQVNRLKVHGDLLYVAGSFGDYPPNGHPDNPGSGILAWDGEQWHQLGSGTRGAGNPSVLNMTWINDTLYAVGRFNMIGDIPTGRVARWDGNRWCSLVPPNYFYPDIVGIGSFRDTLIVGGSFVVAGPDSINRVAKWIGGDHVDACGPSTGYDEMVQPSIAIYPNPASTHLYLRIDLPLLDLRYHIYDLTGRSVLEGIMADPQVDISRLSPAVYLLKIEKKDGSVIGSTRFQKM